MNQHIVFIGGIHGAGKTTVSRLLAGLLSASHITAGGLIRETARIEADVIVVGGSGGGLAGSYSLGSVVNELLYSSPVPVVVAPRGTRDSAVDRVREVTCAIGRRQGMSWHRFQRRFFSARSKKSRNKR